MRERECVRELCWVPESIRERVRERERETDLCGGLAAAGGARRAQQTTSNRRSLIAFVTSC